MKLLFENWRKYLLEMAFESETKTVVGFDFDHTLARTAGGQVAYFDPGLKWRATRGAINPKYFETHSRLFEPGQAPEGGKEARLAPLSDADIKKIMAMPNGPEKKAIIVAQLNCNGENSKVGIEPFWCPSQAQLDFYSVGKSVKTVWYDDPKNIPIGCWSFDFSSRDKLGWENGTPEASVQAPVMIAFKEAVNKMPATEVIILTARTSAVEGQIAEFLRKVGAPPLPSKHIIGCEGCNKGEFLYNEVLVNEKNYNINNLYFYDDSNDNVATIEQYIKKAVDEGLIEGRGIVYKVEKHKGNYKIAAEYEAEKPQDIPELDPEESEDTTGVLR